MKLNKTKQILARLLKGERLTVHQMSIDHYINHPLTVICVLRKRGYDIKSKKIPNPTGSDYNSYWIEK